MKKTIRLSFVGALLVTTLQAEQNSITLAPLEVVSTAIKTDELRSSDAVEVYTQQDIEKSHVQNIYEFLNKESSVTTLPSYGNKFTQKLDMRGFGYENGYQNIVVKVNGRKLNNVDMVPQLLSSISPNQIERIEIIKGSGIVEAGDGANAGVINIVLKESNQKEIGIYVGSYNTFDGNFYIGHSDDTLSLNISGEAQKNGGIRHIDDDGEKDSSKFSNFAFDMTYAPIEALELRLNAQTSDIDTWYAGSLTKEEYEDDIFQKGEKNYGATRQFYTSDVIGTGVSYFINDTLSINADFNHEYKTSEYPAYSFAARYIYNAYNANIHYDTDTLDIVAGIDGFDGDRRNGSITSKENLAGYVLAKYKLKQHSFKAGYRYEKVSYEYDPQAGSSLNDDEYLNGVELGYNYALDNEMSFFASYERSYQAPDIDRFFATTYPPPDYTPVVSFNGFISPSKAHNYTVGYNYITKQNKLKLSLYYIDLSDEIYYFKDPSGFGSKNTNIDESSKYGIDIYEKYLVNENFDLMFNYTYVMAKIDKEIQNGYDFGGNELPGVSNHNLKATLNYMPNKQTTLSLTQVYRSKAYAANDFGNDFSQKQDAYYSTDISLSYVEKKWELFAKVNNIFNQKNGIWIADDKIYPLNYTTTAYAGLKLKY